MFTHPSPVLGGVNARRFAPTPLRVATGLTPPPLRVVGFCFASGGTERREERMLRIYIVCIEIVREVRPYAERIGRLDPDLARQLKRASVSVVLNVAEGSGGRAGRRRNSYDIALGEARETLACLQAAEAIGYVSEVAPDLRDRIDRVIATLVKLVR